MLEQECNSAPCTGSWSCWSEWGHCNREGRRSRSRQCVLPVNGGHSSSSALLHGPVSVECSEGPAREEEDCRHDHSGGGKYDGGRSSVSSSPGQTAEPMFPSAETDGVVGGGISINILVGATAVGFMFGCATGALLVYYYFVRHRKQADGGGGHHNGGMAGQHYISAKNQNLYVSLPMLDMKQKPLCGGAESEYSGGSVCGGSGVMMGTLRSNGGNNGTLRSKSSIYGTTTGGQPGEYETATIKRSHSRRDSSLLSGGIRADMDSDQPFT